MHVFMFEINLIVKIENDIGMIRFGLTSMLRLRLILMLRLSLFSMLRSINCIIKKQIQFTNICGKGVYAKYFNEIVVDQNSCVKIQSVWLGSD